MKTEYKSKTLSQLKQAEGMLKRVRRMVEDDVYCIKTLQQALAVVGLVKSSNKMILQKHLSSCFKKGMSGKGSKKQSELINELVGVMDKT